MLVHRIQYNRSFLDSRSCSDLLCFALLCSALICSLQPSTAQQRNHNSHKSSSTTTTPIKPLPPSQIYGFPPKIASSILILFMPVFWRRGVVFLVFALQKKTKNSFQVELESKKSHVSHTHSIPAHPHSQFYSYQPTFQSQVNSITFYPSPTSPLFFFLERFHIISILNFPYSKTIM